MQTFKGADIMQENHRLKGKRAKLSEVLPLDTPFVVHIDVSSVCNFKCKFCFHSIEHGKTIKFRF
jgi:MoaA/NifB/PqqE/SkfB family radical SAM enzyme